MRIDPKATLAGVPLISIRDFLRRHSLRLWTVADAARDLHLSENHASAVIDALVRDGYVEKDADARSIQHWKSTSLGAKLAAAHATRPISRRTADQKLAELITRARHVNQTDSFAFRVRRITVIGSYLSNAPTVSDIDIIVSLMPRLSDRTSQELLEQERRRQAVESGRRFGNFTQQLGWPEDEVKLFLKSRSRTLQFVSEGASFLADCPKRVVFESDREA